MGLFDPETEDEAGVLVTTVIAGMATGAIPQLDWSHTADNGVINERGRRHAATIAVGAFAIADAIVAEGQRRAATLLVEETQGATASSPDEELDRQAALADPPAADEFTADDAELLADANHDLTSGEAARLLDEADEADDISDLL